MECNTSGQAVLGQTGKTICQELTINLVAPGKKMQYTPTDPGAPVLLTLVVCHPGWDDYLYLGKTVNEMAQHLIEEDAQQERVPSTTSATPKPADVARIMQILPDPTVMVLATELKELKVLTGRRPDFLL